MIALGQKVAGPKKIVTKSQGDNNMTTERLQEESLTGFAEELQTDNYPMSGAKDSVQNTK